MNRMIGRSIWVTLSMVMLGALSVFAEGDRVVSIEEFIATATEKDTVFESILIDEYALHYRKDLLLPARDVVLSLKGQYDFMTSRNKEEPDGSVGLSKLFPYTGTQITTEYSAKPSYTRDKHSSSYSVGIAQPIAENAFGHATRLKDAIIGVENAVAEYQIVEAYEDYLAAVLSAYYSWYEAYENLKVGTSSYEENLKLLDNMKERQKNNIALPIDVNKVHLQVLGKKEKLAELTEAYDAARIVVFTAMRCDPDEAVVPTEPALYDAIAISFERDYALFLEESRTYEVLTLLEEQSRLQVEKDGHDLLPSLDMILGYTIEGDDFFEDEDSMMYAGLSFQWPLPDQVERAEHETSKIAFDKTKLTTINTHHRLYTDVKGLSYKIERERQLLAIAREKVVLARSVLEDESENYSVGKVTLNDFISAVNLVDNNRFNEIKHAMQYKKYVVEWLRLTDQLVNKKDILA